jgi:hypothetical protein
MSLKLFAPLLLAGLVFPSRGGWAKRPAPAPVRLSVAGNSFALNGKKTFLLGVSYFDGRNWRDSDLEELARRGFNLVRIWLDWHDHDFFDSHGHLIHQKILLDLVQDCGRRGMVVDATLLDTSLSFDDAAEAVKETVTALRSQRNVLYDLVNEHDHSGRTFSHAELKQLAAVARKADPKAILTVSSTESHLEDAGRNVDAANLRAEAVDLGLNAISPHFPRTADWYLKTGSRVKTLRRSLLALHKNLPIFLEEEARRGYGGMNPSPQMFFQAAQAAREAGAAGWVFHTAAGFDMKGKSFFDHLDPAEKATIDLLGHAVATANPGSTPSPKKAG